MNKLKALGYGYAAGLTGYISAVQLIDYSARKFAEVSRVLETGRELGDKLINHNNIFDLPLVGMFAGSITAGTIALAIYEIAKTVKEHKDN